MEQNAHFTAGSQIGNHFQPANLALREINRGWARSLLLVPDFHDQSS
jgi:hypothetical protein